MNAAAPIAPARIGWPGATLLILAGVVSAFHVGKPSAVLAQLQADLGVATATAAWLVSASGIVGAVAGTPVGLLVDRLGARRMTVLGLAVQALASAAGALATAPAWLLASRVLEGLGFQWVVVAAPAWIAGAMRPGTAAAMAAWSTFMPAGLAAALLSAAFLPATAGWDVLWWSAAVLALALAVAIRFALPEPPFAEASRSRSIRGDLAAAWQARSPVLLALLFGLFNALYFAVYGFLPMLLQQASQAVGIQPQVLAAAAVGASAAGNLAGLAVLAKGLRPTRLLAGAFAGLAACSVPILLDMAMSAWLRIAASIAFGAVAGLIPAALFAEAPARTPRPGMQGLVIGLMMQGGNVGMSIGTPLAGLVATAFGWPSVIAVVAALSAVAIVAVRALPRCGMRRRVLSAPCRSPRRASPCAPGRRR